MKVSIPNGAPSGVVKIAVQRPGSPLLSQSIYSSVLGLLNQKPAA
jgi:hypothetical protein